MGALLIADGAGKEDLAGVLSSRCHHDPSFVLLGNISILDQAKTKLIYVEVDGLVVITHDDGNEADGLTHGSKYTNERLLLSKEFELHGPSN
jgi:hypothetical protein